MYETKPDDTTATGWYQEPKAPDDPTGWSEIARSTRDASHASNELLSGYWNLNSAYDDHIKKVKELTGAELRNPNSLTYGVYESDDEKRRFKADLDQYRNDGGAANDWAYSKTWREKEFRRQLEDLAVKHPEHRPYLLPDASFISQAYDRAHRAEKREADVWDRSNKSVFDYSAWLAGGLWAAAEDPVNWVTAPLGAGGAAVGAKGLAMGALKAGGLNAAVEAGVQPFVQSYRGQAGLDSGFDNAAVAVGSAFAFGAGADAGIRGIARGLRFGMGYEPVVHDGVVVGYRKRGEAPVVDGLTPAPAIPPELEARAKAGDKAAMDEITTLLSKEKSYIPEDLVKRADAEDPAAIREVAERSGMADDPTMRHALDAMDANERIAEPPAKTIAKGDHDAAISQGLRHAADPDMEPVPVVRENVSPGTIQNLKGDILDLHAEIRRMGDDLANDPASHPPTAVADMRMKLAETIEAHEAARRQVFADDVIEMVDSGRASQEIADIVAAHVDNKAVQGKLLTDLMARKPDSAAEARNQIAELLASPDYRPQLIDTEAAPAGLKARQLDDPYGPEAQKQVQALEAQQAEELGRKTAPPPTPEQIVEQVKAVIDRGEEVRTAIAEVAGIVPPGVEVKVFSSIADLPDALRGQVEMANAKSFAVALERFQSATSDAGRAAARRMMDDAKTGRGIEGIAHDNTIWIASYAMNPEGRVAHEVVHALRTMGQIAPDEIRILADYARENGSFDGPKEKLYRTELESRGYSEARVAELLDEEAAAHAIEAAKNAGDTPTPVKTITDRVFEFVEKVKSALRGHGFMTAEEKARLAAQPANDVIQSFMSGEMMKREGVKAWMRQEDLTAYAMRDGLDMSPEARKQRAEEMGFDTSRVWYHGSKQRVDAFDLKKAGKTDPGLVGKAVYFADDGGQAGVFALSSHYGSGDAPNVTPVYLKLTNPALINDGVLPDGRSLTDAHPNGITKQSANKLKKDLLAAGYDGAIFKLGGETVQAAVFDPKNIRSVNAAFDPAKASSPNLMFAFAGERAKTADLAALAKAKEMTASGLDRAKVWHDTGWFQGVDGKWRFEIDDSKSYGDLSAARAEGFAPNTTVPLDHVLGHKGLYAAYPDLENTGIRYRDFPDGYDDVGGSYARKTDEIVLNSRYRDFANDGVMHSFMLHEAQHRAQAKEGYARGGNYMQFTPEEIAAERARLMAVPEGNGWTSVGNTSGDMSDREVGHSLYRRLAGEAEARLVQKRMDMTPDERRARPPWLDYDVPESQQIVRGMSEPMFAMVDTNVGREMKRDLDRLGYFSGALEAAKKIKQAKGTPEQMLSQLRAGGAKAGEIEATGLDKFLQDKAVPATKYYHGSNVDSLSDLRPDSFFDQDYSVAERYANDRARSRGGKPTIYEISHDPKLADSGHVEDAWSLAKNRYGESATRSQMQSILAGQGYEGIDIGGKVFSLFENTKVKPAQAPKASNLVTRDEIVKHLEGNRLGLNEVKYGGGGSGAWEGARQLPDIPLAEGATGPAKWSRHSLDPSNPTYRETVLHLPKFEPTAAMREPYEAASKRYQDALAKQETIDRRKPNLSPDELAIIDEVKAAQRDLQNTSAPVAAQNFESGHFSEPNIVGHMMTSMTKHEGKPVYTIDQIQSDWGQKLRDGGVRDEAKISDIRKQLGSADEARVAAMNEVEAKLKELAAPMPKLRTTAKFKDHFDTLPKEVRDQIQEPMMRLEINAQHARMLDAELRTAEASSPGHPLVNTTDQWSNTTLRRAIRQAAEADAEYIAVPHGDTVLSYNPGERDGMVGFYGSRSAEGIVPKNLRKMLEKIDGTIKPQRVTELETSDGKLRGWQGPGLIPKNDARTNQTGFTLFPLTEKVKASVKQEGLPLFAMKSEPEVRAPEQPGITPERISQLVQPYLDAYPNITRMVQEELGRLGSTESTAPGGASAFTMPPTDVAKYIKTADYDRAMHAQYADGASSRQVPFAGELPPVGTWRIADRNGLYGRDIEQLRSFAADELLLPEVREGKLDPTKRGDDERYAQWIKEGKRPPPIEVLQMDDGRFRVMDGHRRALAAQQAGQPIDAWVSYSVPTGKLDSNGNPMKTSLTYELAQSNGERISGQAGTADRLNQNLSSLIDTIDLPSIVSRLAENTDAIKEARTALSSVVGDDAAQNIELAVLRALVTGESPIDLHALSGIAKQVMDQIAPQAPAAAPPMFAMRDAEGRMKLDARERAKQLQDDLAAIEAQFQVSGGDERMKLQAKRAALLGSQAFEKLIDDTGLYTDGLGRGDRARALMAAIETHGENEMVPFADLVSLKKDIGSKVFGMVEGMLWDWRKGAFTGDLRRRFNSSVKANMENVIREASGVSTNDGTAKVFAKAWLEATEYLRQRFNAAGGDIGKLAGWFMPQFHDADALIKIGREGWVERLMTNGVLDRDRIIDYATNAPMKDAELRSMLKEIWLAITSDGASRMEIGDAPAGKGALYKRHMEHRVLHFKDADQWMKYNRDFGGGDIYSAMIGHVDMMARDIAMMERFGPNPERTMQRIKATILNEAKMQQPAKSMFDDFKDRIGALKAELKNLPSEVDEITAKIGDVHTQIDAVREGAGSGKRARRRVEGKIEDLRKLLGPLHERLEKAITTNSATPAQRVMIDKIQAAAEEMALAERWLVTSRNPTERTNRLLSRADEMMKVYNGTTNTPIDSKFAGAMVGVRNIISASSLVYAPFSAVTDQATQLAARQFIGMPATSILSSFVKGFAQGDRRLALEAGLGLDQVAAAFAQQARFVGGFNARHITGYITDRSHAYSLLSPMTQASKVAFGLDFMRWMAGLRETAFKDLGEETTRMMAKHGFTAEDFAALRLAQPEKGLLTRNAVAKAAGDDVAEKYMRMLIRERGQAVLEGTIQGRTAFISDTQPGTVTGELLRSVAMLKSFSMSYMTQILGRLYNETMAGRGLKASTLGYGASIFIVGTMLGALAKQLKNVGQGRDPEDMSKAKFWAEAFMQSGGAGIFGDFIGSSVNRMGGGLASTIMGPIADRGGTLLDLTAGNVSQYAKDEKTNAGRELTKVLRQNTPGMFAPWYIRLAYERLLLDELQKKVDPEYYKSFDSKVKAQKKRSGNDFWWTPGGASRAPDLGAAFGQQ